MSEVQYQTRVNAMNINSVLSFAGVRGSLINGCKDVYFVRMLGYSENALKEIVQADEMLTHLNQQGEEEYIHIESLPKFIEPGRTSEFIAIYEKWKASNYSEIGLSCLSKQEELHTIVRNAIMNIIQTYKTQVSEVSESIIKNFTIKIFYWMESLLCECLKEWEKRRTYKLILSGEVRIQEYLFLSMLTKIGFDVFIFAPEGELKVPEKLLELSVKIQEATFGTVKIPYNQKKKETIVHRESIPKQDQSIAKQEQSAAKQEKPVNSTVVVPQKKRPRSELDFEQLAQLASSVVMIGVHDHKGKVYASGSGIMIGREGYILTNYHVISGGFGFFIRIEDNDETYETREVIKCNQNMDLALLRIDITLNPIPVYGETAPLVRGQKVVAIGSPLGLFNSVSNGIISGFREFDNWEMIQFTAPISHGSSGGALLNMYGELIGISTAGIDEGQNINLAVTYKEIRSFINGFQAH